MYAMLVVVVILLLLIILFLTGTFGGRQAEPGPQLDIDIQVPQTPDAPRPGN
jgi:hypothetical protein